MAITDTKQAKDFTAGAPRITLKGDLRPKKIMADGGRAQYGLGSLVKGVKKAVKGVAKGVKGVVKGVKDNPLLGLAALNFAPMLGGGSPFIGFGDKFAGGKFAGSLFNLPSISTALNLKEGSDFINTLKVGGTGAVITGLLAKREELSEEDPDFSERRAQVNDQLNVQFKRLYPKGEAESDQDYEVRINAMVEAADDSTVPVGEMAEGGRVGYASGTTQFELPFGKPDFFIGKGKNKKAIYKQKDGTNLVVPIGPDNLPNYAIGGRVMRAMGDSASENAIQAAGIEGLPLRENSKGVKEIDLRETGGFIPPVGVKEKADDIPAMLSNNEFVFTADAVRAAGGGSVNKGAQRLYDTMKQLESRVV